ncbi:Sodium/hydrogen exchanger family-domain-containing protein [Aspergillus granulosus]|uniref:Sodium/hydrogen exchanger family-domain-containing protein n=1 Tax=Aspergillus granulosus TaxID=176169 RepID=A0ABR4GYQ3_9EURO
MAESAFAYHEPSILTILNQTGLLLVLNLVNTCLDKLLYCGLIGQLFIGILWGTPGAKWLDRDMETVIQQLGYLGLIMLVYEGGLSTSLSSLRANMYLSLAVACTGIVMPMALSFILMELVSATPLQAFAAGAALSATSLGTTFTILSTTELITTRLGTVTTSAAMLDDVVGLVMVQIISNLGGSGDSFSAVTVIRPLFVSLGFGIGVVLACRFLARPVLLRILGSKSKLPQFTRTPQFAFLGYTALLVGMVAGATYAGTSSLFAAYLAGVIASWFDSLVHSTTIEPQPEIEDPSVRQAAPQSTPDPARDSARGSFQPVHEHVTGTYVYEHYYHGPVTRILIPMFFASIGFAIPITEMFEGSIVWRGFVYAILMTFSKMCTGLWLVRFSPVSGMTSLVRILKAPFAYARTCIRRQPSKAQREKSRTQGLTQDSNQAQPVTTVPDSNKDSETSESKATAPTIQSGSQPQTSPLPPKPKSLYPASILSLAMVARGEIGYLIASLAESNGIFGETTDGSSSETYLIVVWAISLCTLVGPICVGTLVKRVKALQKGRDGAGRSDPLGVWGI